MRHLTGVGLAVALGAAVFFAATWGYLRLLTIPVTNGGGTLPGHGGSLLHDTGVLESFAALAGTALLAGLCVAVRRISPLAAGLPGLVAIAWTVVYGFNVTRAVRYIPFKYEVFGDGFEAMLFNGLLAVAGLVLVVPLFIPSRWRAQPAYASRAGVSGQAAPYPPYGQYGQSNPYGQSNQFGQDNQYTPYAAAGGQETAPAAATAATAPAAATATDGDPTAPYPADPGLARAESPGEPGSEQAASNETSSE